MSIEPYASVEGGYHVSGDEIGALEDPPKAQDWGDDLIERLYDELAFLNRQRLAQPEEASLSVQIREKLVALQQLQEEEASRIRMHFAQQFDESVRAGQQALEAAKGLIRKYEDTPRSN